ncbi:MAG: NADH-quinone oxidoreductase subunit NuoG [Magnetococcus sp. DMHC-6]
MPKLIIDGKEISVQPGTTIMEAAKKLGVFIPHFCYHPKLSISGNCRMCLVEVEKMPKPVASCAMPVSEGMVVHTDSEMVRVGRANVLEFLLINHPLDCPICDQGGECSLQDLAMKYGPDRSRFTEEKRQVKDHPVGPFIETVTNRCIHCTRCIRFSAEIAGVEEITGAFRGDHLHIGTYDHQYLTSELSGNLAQICPVGSLNLKPFHYKVRGWELKKSTGMVCGHCSVGCHIRVDHLNNKIYRVMAQQCDQINESWICDKGRFSYDGYTKNRLEAPVMKNGLDAKVQKVTWQQALDRAAEILKGVKPEEVAGLASDQGQGAEELFAFQDFLRHAVGTPHIDFRIRQRDFSSDQTLLTRADLLMNTPLTDLEKADAVLLIGCDSRFEAPLLNLRLRKAALKGAQIYSLYFRGLDTNLPSLNQILVRPGNEPLFMAELLGAVQQVDRGFKNQEVTSGVDGEKIFALAEVLRQAKNPIVLLGEHAINHPQAEMIRRQAVSLITQIGGIRDGWNGYNRLASRGNIAAQDLGVVPNRGPGYTIIGKTGYHALRILEAAAAGEIKVLFLLGVDPVLECVDTMLARKALENTRVIYIGTYSTPVVEYSDVVLPGLVLGEKESILANCEGRVQRSSRAINGPLECKEDWRILRALSGRFSIPLAYNTIEALQDAIAATDHRYNLKNLDKSGLTVACDHKPVSIGLEFGKAVPTEQIEHTRLVLESSFYEDDQVTRHSELLAQLHFGHIIMVNHEDAARAKIREGQRVRIMQGSRNVELIVTIDKKIPKGVVVGHYGYIHESLQDLLNWESGYPEVSLVGL